MTHDQPNITIRLFGLLLASILVFPASAQQVSPAIQIKTALLAAPIELRDSASVLGYNDLGEIVLLREGSNEMICLSDDANQKGFNVACYHRELEPFMARGRELKKEGKTFNEIFDIREAEVKNGTLKMPTSPSTL